MRKAVLILSIIFMLIVLLQSWLVGVGGVMFNDPVLSQGGMIGRVVGLLFGVGAAFVLAKPLVSAGIFVVGGLAGVIAGIITGYYDLILWGVISLALAVMSFFGARVEDKQAPPAAPDEKIRTATQF